MQPPNSTMTRTIKPSARKTLNSNDSDLSERQITDFGQTSISPAYGALGWNKNKSMKPCEGRLLKNNFQSIGLISRSLIIRSAQLVNLPLQVF